MINIVANLFRAPIVYRLIEEFTAELMVKLSKENSKKAPAKAGKRVVFRKDSKDYKALLLLMKKGSVKPTDQPASVNSKYKDKFGKYSLNQFRCQYNNAKANHRCKWLFCLSENCFSINAHPRILCVPVSASSAGDDGSDGGGDDDVDSSGDDSEDEESIAGGAANVVAVPRPARSRYSGNVVKNGNDDFDTPPCWRPKRIVTTYDNEDGVKCAAIIIANTSGCVDKDLRKVEVNCSSDCMGIIAQEEYSDGLLDIDLLYQKLPKLSSESAGDCFAKRMAVKAAVRKLKAEGHHKSIYRIDSPFRIEPTEMEVRYLSAPDKSTFIHIDNCEKKKKENNKLLFYDDKATRSDNNFIPKSTEKKCNELG